MGVRATGILGGAFDPPHDGHVALALAAVDHFRLERLLVRVVEHPGHKHVEASASDRLVLAEIAFVVVAGAEVALDPFARTVDSLESLRLDDPVFLVGADELASFLDWKQPDRVLELARLGVAARPGYPQHKLDDVLASAGAPGPDRALPARSVSGLLVRDPRPGRARRAARRPRPARGGSRNRAPWPLRPACRATLRPRCRYQGRKQTDSTRHRTADRRSLPGEAGDGRRDPRHADGLRLHGLLRDRDGPQPAPDQGNARRGRGGAQARAPAAGALDQRAPEATWIVADYLDVVLHVFTPETREYYRLEDLWNDVPLVELAAVAG